MVLVSEWHWIIYFILVLIPSNSANRFKSIARLFNRQSARFNYVFIRYWFYLDAYDIHADHTIYMQAVFAALFHLINHSTFKGALFMIVGIVDYQIGTRDI